MKKGLVLLLLCIFLISIVSVSAAPAVVEKSRTAIKGAFDKIGTFLSEKQDTKTIKTIDFFMFFILFSSIAIVGLRGWGGAESTNSVKAIAVTFGAMLSLALVWKTKLSIVTLYPFAMSFLVLAVFILFYKTLIKLGLEQHKVMAIVIAFVLVGFFVYTFVGWESVLSNIKSPIPSCEETTTTKVNYAGFYTSSFWGTVADAKLIADVSTSSGVHPCWIMGLMEAEKIGNSERYKDTRQIAIDASKLKSSNIFSEYDNQWEFAITAFKTNTNVIKEAIKETKETDPTWGIMANKLTVQLLKADSEIEKKGDEYIEDLYKEIRPHHNVAKATYDKCYAEFEKVKKVEDKKTDDKKIDTTTKTEGIGNKFLNPNFNYDDLETGVEYVFQFTSLNDKISSFKYEIFKNAALLTDDRWKTDVESKTIIIDPFIFKNEGEHRITINLYNSKNELIGKYDKTFNVKQRIGAPKSITTEKEPSNTLVNLNVGEIKRFRIYLVGIDFSRSKVLKANIDLMNKKTQSVVKLDIFETLKESDKGYYVEYSISKDQTSKAGEFQLVMGVTEGEDLVAGETWDIKIGFSTFDKYVENNPETLDKRDTKWWTGYINELANAK